MSFNSLRISQSSLYSFKFFNSPKIKHLKTLKNIFKEKYQKKIYNEY